MLKFYTWMAQPSFADKAILNKKNLNAGIIRNLGVLMSDESRLLASSQKRKAINIEQFIEIYHTPGVITARIKKERFGK